MRRNQAEKRTITPDIRYKSQIVAKMINMVMKDGKKAVAQRIVYKSFEQLEKKVSDKGALAIFTQALDNVRPQMKVKSRRVGGATYQVPEPVSEGGGTSIAMRWLITYARNKKGKSMDLCLANELLDAFNNSGSAVKKKEDTHKMAVANRAYAHFRF